MELEPQISTERLLERAREMVEKILLAVVVVSAICVVGFAIWGIYLLHKYER